MSTLERAYANVRSRAFLLNEDFSGSDHDGLQPIPDQNVTPHLLPDYAKNFITGSGRGYNNDQGRWFLEYKLKFPFNQWSDGTEDIETTFEYVEKQIRGQLNNTGDNPRGQDVRSSAVVDGENSNNQEIVVRVVSSGGINV